jgi:NTP pyrophosphatase (non-canonical NTP hydrolase)
VTGGDRPAPVPVTRVFEYAVCQDYAQPARTDIRDLANRLAQTTRGSPRDRDLIHRTYQLTNTHQERHPVITDRRGNQIDDATALHRIVAALDLRFPDHNTPGDRLGRLLEEIGELSEAVLAIEKEPALPSADSDPRATATKEVQDILRAVGGVAHHYQLPTHLPDTSGYPQPGNPYVLLALLVQGSGTLAEAVHHMAGMGMKRDKHGEPTVERLTRAVDMVIVRTLVIADHYELREALRESIQTYYRNYQRDGFLPDDAEPADEP